MHVSLGQDGETAKNNRLPSADEAKVTYKQEHRRSLEIRASFYEKLSALNAGSIAITVSVGIALLGKADARFGSVHSHLSWLLWIAGLLWISLICSVVHNSIYVKIAKLEAEQAQEWSKYLALLSDQLSASGEAGEALTKLFTDTFHRRIVVGALNMHQTEQTLYRTLLLGKTAVATFLLAYTLVMFAVIRLWWLSR